MQGYCRSAVLWATSLGRYWKRGVLVVTDLIILGLALWCGFSLRYGEFYVPPSFEFALLMASAPLITVLTFFQFDIYRIVTRFMGGRTINKIALAVTLSILIWSLFVFMTGVNGVPRGALFIYGPLGIAGVWGVRQVAGWLLKSAGVPVPDRPVASRVPVMLYGAGPAALQLANALERSDRYEPVGFVDRKRTLWGQFIGGYKVYRPDKLPGLIDRFGVKEVMVALSEETRRERLDVLHELETLQIAVRTLPAFEDIADGRITVNDLRSVDAGDLLGRDPVPPNQELLSRNTTGKVVMVTGAGGSIGSELARQIIRQQPRRLVLFDMGENALYEIESEMQRIIAGMASAVGEQFTAPEVVAILGSVLDRQLIDESLELHGVQTIYHAAAYKHVPIVERNMFTGLRNNTFGTLVLSDAAQRHGVDRFVLISTDKAVRPSSVMGASKRLSEMILQARASGGSGKTVFTMVRFGNVLDSSGSVVKRFREQITRGGPVTVTHPEMIRYFMSIPEAAALVIQAGAMAQGGEVFVLDMGEPVKIDSLARSMIRLMGLEVRDKDNPTGDIAIEYVGLRVGEKLREELLIGDNTTGTEHPRIQTSREPCLPVDVLERELGLLRDAINAGEAHDVHECLKRTVEGYQTAVHDASDSTIVGTADSSWPRPISRSIH